MQPPHRPSLRLWPPTALQLLHAMGFVAAAAAATAACAILARLPGLGLAGFGGASGAWTLGLPIDRLGEATTTVVLAACVGRALAFARGRGGGRGRDALGGARPPRRWTGFATGILGSATLALAGFALLGTDVPRRRGVLMAVAGAAAFESVLALHRSLVRRAGQARQARPPGASRIWPVATATLIAAAATLTVAGLDRLDARPARTGLPPVPSALLSAAPKGAPCILLVTVDTTRAMDVGAYGSARGATPTLDALADRGVTFLSATAPAPHTHPSMGALLTGCPPRVHGSVSGSPHLATDVTTLAEHLRRHGYRTAGFLDNPWLGPEFGLARGYEHLDRVTDLARIEHWLERGDARPFLLHVHYLHPHGPYERCDNPVGNAIVGDAVGRVGQRVSAGTIQRGEVPGRHGFGRDEIDRLHDLYLSEVRAMDGELAALLRAVEARVSADRLVTVVAGDHGEEFDERGGLHHSHTLFEELVHVPLVLRAPGLRPARVGASVSLVDVAPTVLELAGLPPLPRAFGAALALDSRCEDRVVISERVRQAGRQLTSARRGAWKLHARTRDGSFAPLATGWQEPEHRRAIALFDLESDPSEHRDVADEHPSEVAALLDALVVFERRALEVEAQRRRSGERPVDPAVSYRTRADLRSLGY